MSPFPSFRARLQGGGVPLWAGRVYHLMPKGMKEAIRRLLLPPSPPAVSGACPSGRSPWRQNFFPLDPSWAEVVFAPFHDPMVSPSLPVIFRPLEATGCSVAHEWCWTRLQWDSCDPGRDAAEFMFAADVDLRGYDRLVFCLTVPPHLAVRFEALLDGRRLQLSDDVPGAGTRMEVTLPVTGGHLTEVKATFRVREKGGRSVVYLTWFAMQNSPLLVGMQAAKPRYDPEWPGLIRPFEEWGEVRFERGLLFDVRDLEGLRRKKDLPGWRSHFRFLEGKAEEFLERTPEDDIGEYLPTGEPRYIRAREKGRTPFFFEAVLVGFVGLVNSDERLMRHALRYLMSMVHCDEWTQSAESRLRGSTWDQRCFVEEVASTSVSLLFDWYGFALSPRARDLVLQSLWDKGLSFIERDLMKYEYLHHMNQGAYFCRARILGGLLLENSWPRMKNYVEGAFSDLEEVLKEYLLPDGGVTEGTGYFCLITQAVFPAVIAYARRRYMSPKKLLGRHFSRSGDYVATMSGVRPGTAMVDGDCRTHFFCGDVVPVMAGFFPGSVYEKILAACLEEESVYAVTGSLAESGGITGFIYGPEEIAESRCVVPTFSILPATGQMASYRKEGGQSVRVQLSGCAARPSHSHLDKGALTVEVNGRPTFIDRGMLRYDDSRASLMKSSCLHNVITPLAAEGLYPDQNPAEEPIVPRGSGTNSGVRAEIDLEGVWHGHMLALRREIRADSLDGMEITDRGTLAERGRVAFHLHSTLPFERSAKGFVVAAQDFEVTVSAPWAEEGFAREELINHLYEPVYHLVFHSGDVREFEFKTRLLFRFQRESTAQGGQGG